MQSRRPESTQSSILAHFRHCIGNPDPNDRQEKDHQERRAVHHHPMAVVVLIRGSLKSCQIIDWYTRRRAGFRRMPTGPEFDDPARVFPNW